jgi:Uncharacterised nucleotidyltransferase
MASKSNLAIYPDRRPEAELLLLCSRIRLKPDKAQRARELLEEGIDWDYVTQQALYHGTIPLLFRNLSLFCPDRIPAATLNQFRDFSNGIACSNLRLTGELLSLLNLFRRYGIRALPIKGPALAATVYGNLALRQFTDLDILIPREDMVKAKELLIQQGYSPNLQLTASQESDYLKSHHDYKFIRAKDGLVIEIQWGITERLFSFPLDFADLWNRCEKLSLAGVELLSLALEDLLLLLCVHGSKHRWEQLKWICDIAELVDAYRQKIDWGRVLDRARMLGGERMLLLGLFLASDLLRADLPAGVPKKMAAHPQIKCLSEKVNDGLFRQTSGPLRLADEPPFFYLKMRERLSDRLDLLWKYLPEYFLRTIVPNSKDSAFLELPPYLSISYYAIRPIRLLSEHWPTILHRLRSLMSGLVF